MHPSCSIRLIKGLEVCGVLKRLPCTPLQGKQVLVDGVGRCPETEVEVPPDQARGYLSDPNRLLEAGLPLVDGLKQ